VGTWTEMVVGERGVRRWLGDCRAPARADGPHVHVRVDTTGGAEDAVGDVLHKVRWKRCPVRHGQSVVCSLAGGGGGARGLHL
jgi:hypothetical protein